jgi:hypothetical protein
MIKYYMQKNGTGTAYMVTCDTENEAQGELWSLQNKGVAMQAEQVSPISFIFYATPNAIKQAFFLQGIYKLWNNFELCKTSKGKIQGFKDMAKQFAEEKFANMRDADWLLNQASLPEIYTCGKVSAEKGSGDWKDTLTKVVQST